jgi:hypothetical protein
MSLAFKLEETFNAELQRIFTVLNDVASWSVFDKPRVLGTKGGKITLAFEDQTRAFINFEILPDGVRVQIVHELLTDEAAIKPRELYWREVLAGIHRRLELS